MYEIYNNKIGVPVGWMIENDIISLDNWKKLVIRNQVIVLRRGCRGRSALAELNSLPKRYYNQVVELAGKPDKVKRMSNLENEYEPVAEVIKFFDDWTFDGGRKLTPEKRAEYICNAQLLVAANKLAIRLTNKRKVVTYPRTIQGKKVSTVWEMIADDLAELDTKDYPHSLPLNLRRLQEKVKRYMKDGPICLIHKNFQNKTASKVKDDVQEAFLRQALAHENNLDAEQVASLYNAIAVKSGWDTITASTVRKRAKAMKLEIFFGRNGQEFFNKMTMQVTRRAPSFPLFYWTLDGWRVELNYQQRGETEDGKKVTTYHHRLTIVIVLDACGKYPIGYAIGEREDLSLIKEALRNAINHTKELFGSRYKPHQIQSDNFATSKEGGIKEAYRSICEHYTPARVHNAKAKIIEPYFKYLQKEYFQYCENWTGFGVKTAGKLQPNYDIKNKNKHRIPERNGVIKQINTIMDLERSKKREKFLELWNKCPEAKKLPITMSDYLLHFGEQTEYNSITGRGLEPKVLGRKMRFDTFDLRFRQEGERLRVLFDPADLSEVLAVNKEGDKQYVLYPPHTQPMALVEREAGDAAALQKVFEFNDAIVEHVIQTKAADQKNIEQHISAYPELDSEVLTKMMISDSRGQHKIRLQEANGEKERIKKVLKEKAIDVKEEKPRINVRAIMAEGIPFDLIK